MKGNSKTYALLEDIVHEALMDLGEGEHRKEQFLHWGIKYMRKLHFDAAREVKTVKLEMTPWKSVVLPEDCVDWTMLGIQCGNIIKTFVNDNGIALMHNNGVCEKKPNENCKNIEDIDYDGEGMAFFNYTYYGEDPGKLFGLAVKDNGVGYFTENRNKDSNEIQLNVSVKSNSTVYLEYISNYFDPCKDSVVHPYAIDYIVAGIHYENLRHNKNNPRSLVGEAKQVMDEEYVLLAERGFNLTADDIIEYRRQGYKLTPKR
jgi:hypothetical protein